MEIYYSRTFAKQYHRLPDNVKRLAEKQETIFRIDPFHPALKTHRLTGKLKRYWSFSIDYHYRIVFEFINPSSIYFYAVGTHDQVF